MIQEQYIHIDKRETFNSLKEEIKDDSLTFINETGTIYHHGKEFLQPTWKTIGGPPEAPTTLTLDQTISDPTQMITGPLGKDGTPDTNVVSYIRRHSHRYVGTYDANVGMILKQLNDDDSTKYADGTDASEDITTKDVFMKMPTFWFKGEQVEAGNEDKWHILFSAVEPTDKDWTKWDGNNLIGVYKAVAENTGNNTTGGLFSRSGATPTASLSQINSKAKARNRSNGDDHFMIVTYEAHQVMALLYICYYGNMNAQEVIGSGAPVNPKITGQTNVDGMNDTVAENTRSINFWGLENWWVYSVDPIDNIITEGGGANNSAVTIRDYYGNFVRRVSGCTSNSGEIQKMILGEALDMLPKSTISNSKYNTYYCDSGNVSYFDSQIMLRSVYSSALNGGPFYLYNSAAASSNGEYGSRLQYHGRVIITK